MDSMSRRCFGWGRWLVTIALGVGLFSGVSAAQSLAELAKKEKERRSQIGSKETTKVISERDLQRAGRSPAPLPASATPAGEAAGGEQASGEGEEEAEAPEESKTREYWQNRVDGAKKKIADVEAKLNAPESNWGGGMRTDVNPYGQRNLSQRQELESQLAAAKSELQSIQEEARRAGVPSSWVR
jgi:hypothetical protein